MAQHRGRPTRSWRGLIEHAPGAATESLTQALLLNDFDSFDSDDESSDPVEDEHHAILDCSGNAYVHELFPDLFQGHISIVSHFLIQPFCNRMAKFVTWIGMLRMNKAWSDGSVPGPEQTLKLCILS